MFLLFVDKSPLFCDTDQVLNQFEGYIKHKLAPDIDAGKQITVWEKKPADLEWFEVMFLLTAVSTYRTAATRTAQATTPCHMARPSDTLFSMDHTRSHPSLWISSRTSFSLSGARAAAADGPAWWCLPVLGVRFWVRGISSVFGMDLCLRWTCQLALAASLLRVHAVPVSLTYLMWPISDRPL